MSWLGFLKYLGDVRKRIFPGHLGSCFSYIELAGIHADGIWLAALMSGEKNPGHQGSKP